MSVFAYHLLHFLQKNGALILDTAFILFFRQEINAKKILPFLKLKICLVITTLNFFLSLEKKRIILRVPKKDNHPQREERRHVYQKKLFFLSRSVLITLSFFYSFSLKKKFFYGEYASRIKKGYRVSHLIFFLEKRRKKHSTHFFFTCQSSCEHNFQRSKIRRTRRKKELSFAIFFSSSCSSSHHIIVHAWRRFIREKKKDYFKRFKIEMRRATCGVKKGDS